MARQEEQEEQEEEVRDVVVAGGGAAGLSAASADGARVAARINADLVYDDTGRAVARLAKAEATR